MTNQTITVDIVGLDAYDDQCPQRACPSHLRKGQTNQGDFGSICKVESQSLMSHARQVTCVTRLSAQSRHRSRRLTRLAFSSFVIMALHSGHWNGFMLRRLVIGQTDG
jgi:hypothetical protein